MTRGSSQETIPPGHRTVNSRHTYLRRMIPLFIALRFRTSPIPASAVRGKRDILKGWGSSASLARPHSVRPMAPPPLTPPPVTTIDSPSSSRSATPQQQLLEHSRSPSTTSSLSTRGLKSNHRESWVAIAENNQVMASSSSTGPSPLTQGMSLSEALSSIDEQEATEFAAAQARRETVSSLRPPISPASTEGSQGPRPSVDELSMRSSQFEIVTPLPPQRSNSSYRAERI